MCGIETVGYWARCGGEGCSEVLFFQYPEATVVCQECKSVCDLCGAIVEYETLVMRIIQAECQPVDAALSGMAEKGWLVDKANVVLEPGPTLQHIVVIYLLRRLVANRRFTGMTVGE